MKKLIVTLALASMSALAAQYPLNRVSSVTSPGSAGIGTNEVEDIVRLYDETNLTERLGSLSDRIDGKQGVMHALDGICIDPDDGISVPGWSTVSNAALTARGIDDNVSRVDGYSYGPWDLTDARAKYGSGVDGMRVEHDGDGFAWVLVRNGREEVARSSRYATERAALAATNVTVGAEMASVVRTSSRVSSAGDSFVTWEFVTNNPAFSAMTRDVGAKVEVKRDLSDNVCSNRSVEVLGPWDFADLKARLAEEAIRHNLFNRQPRWNDEFGEYVLSFNGSPSHEASEYAWEFAGMTGIKSSKDYESATSVRVSPVKCRDTRTSGPWYDYSYLSGTVARRPYTEIATPGEPYTTKTFVVGTVADAVSEATRFSVVSNGTGSVTLDADPRKLLFGSENLSNLVVNIVRQLIGDGRLYTVTNGTGSSDSRRNPVLYRQY